MLLLAVGRGLPGAHPVRPWWIETRVRSDGGLLPAVAFTIVAATGNVFAGLWYPVSLSALCFAVGALALPETRGRPIDR